MDSPTRLVPHACLGPAAQEVRAFADAISVGTSELRPTANCPWHEEIPALVGEMRLERGATERILGLGQRTMQILIRSVTDHLYALSNCIADRTLFPVSSLARIAVEAAAWAAWLSDDRFDAQTTLARNIKLQKKSVKAECVRLRSAMDRLGVSELAIHLDGLLEVYASELDECVSALRHLGVVRNSKVPGKTEIVREMLFRAALPGLAEIAYGHHSSMVHSEPFALLRSLNAGDETYSDLQRSMTVQTKLSPVLETLRVSSWLVETMSLWWDNRVDAHGLDELAGRVHSIGWQFRDDASEVPSE